MVFYLAWWEGLDGSRSGAYYATKGTPCQVREVSARVEPRTLNLKSKGNWVTAFLTTRNASAADLDTRNLTLNGVSVAWFVLSWNGTLVAKFDRAAFASTLAPGDSVKVTLTGRWRDGGTFTATDTIRVIRPGR